MDDTTYHHHDEDEEYWQRVADAADDGGTIQAGDMVDLFPGRPEMHTAANVLHALRVAGARGDWTPDGWAASLSEMWDD